MNKFCLILCFAILIIASVNEASGGKKNKKSVTELSEAEVNEIYKQWEENDDDKLELSEDEIPLEDLPPEKRKKPGMNLNMEDIKKMSPEKIQNLQFMNKKGQPLMIIVTLNGNPTKQESEEITSIWQTSLFNANYNFNRYLIDENQAIFYLMDGSLAGEVKDFLIQQERCKDVTIDGKSYPGLHNNVENAENKKEEL